MDDEELKKRCEEIERFQRRWKFELIGLAVLSVVIAILLGFARGVI